MIKSIRPGLLRNKTDSQIEDTLSALFECDVSYDAGVIYIYCLDQYASIKALMEHSTRLANVGSVCWGADKNGGYLKLILNARAREILGIEAETATC